MNVEAAVRALRAQADPSRKPGMARVAIRVDRALGVSVPNIRRIARLAGTDHRLAVALWSTEIHEARILATFVEDPGAISWAQMDRWARQIESWDVGDAAAGLFAATPLRDRAIAEWSGRTEPFVRRCAFAMIARAAVHEKAAPDAMFIAWFPLIEAGATDDRNEVKKAVSWALRQIGKRNAALHADALAHAEHLLDVALASGSKSERWIARDVLRELRHADRGSPARPLKTR
jgi:3-methyladenine DNA glycosylase AlkD